MDSTAERKDRKRMKRALCIGLLVMGLGFVTAQVYGQVATPPVENTGGTPVRQPMSTGSQFMQVVFGSGALGVLLWIFLFASAGFAVYFCVDAAILIQPKRIMPQALVDTVTQAMAEGDVMKALQACEKDPGPLANILTAGFSHVEEGFEVIQESVGTAAELETEKINQTLTWISVMSNIAPMLGLLGTVQGMIMAFNQIAMGAPDVGMLALAIGQALWTTAAGLCVAVPAVTMHYVLKNKANTLILKMEALTMEMIKDLRNVEVVTNE
jgi:biopolymer transport protein ExbB